jgi:dsDNA-specific endonuclease/ATPase MutS2
MAQVERRAPQLRHPTEEAMQYKTITLELLREQRALYEQLRQTHQLLPTLETLSRELKKSHETWKETLAQARPESHPSQIASEAMEMAVKELEERLRPASLQGEEEPLDAAMAFVRNHMSNG